MALCDLHSRLRSQEIYIAQNYPDSYRDKVRECSESNCTYNKSSKKIIKLLDKGK